MLTSICLVSPQFVMEKHSIRYFGPYLWSKLSAIDKNRLTIIIIIIIIIITYF